MAIDFPSSPTVGQIYTFAGVTYTFTAQGVWATAGNSNAAGGSSVTITSGTTNLDSTHNGKIAFLDASGGNITLTITANASLPTDWRVMLVRIDSSSNTITLDPNSTETVDGRATARLVSQFDEAAIAKQGSNFVTLDAKWRRREVRFTTPGAYTFTVANEVPLGCTSYRVEATGAGGSGGGANSTTSQRFGGGGGGACGRIRILTTLDTTITGSVGTGGAAVLAVAGGVAGNNGGSTTVIGTNLGTKTAGGGSGAPADTSGGTAGTISGFDENLIGEGGAPTTYALAAIGGGGNAAGGGGTGGKTNIGVVGNAPGGGGAGSNHPASSPSGAGANGAVTFYI